MVRAWTWRSRCWAGPRRSSRRSASSATADAWGPSASPLARRPPRLASRPPSRAGCGAAVAAASEAFTTWRRVPPGDRIQPLFRLKALLDAHFTDLARVITLECGKTLAESEGELKRGIENVEVAAGIPSLMLGMSLEDIASGIDELMIRQPVGVVGVVTPFNFPGMIPLWFMPYAVACGNTVVLKPSEKTPTTMARLMPLVGEAGVPPGVVN